MQLITKELQSQLAELSFCDISYSVYPADGFKPKSSSRADSVSHAHQHFRQYPLISTCPLHQEFVGRYRQWLYKRRIPFAPFMLKGHWPSKFVRTAYCDVGDKLQSEKTRLFADYGVNSEASLFVNIHDEQLAGHFMINSTMSQQDLDETLEQALVRKTLELTHFYLTRRFRAINPHVHNGTIKPRTLKVLDLISKGANSQEAAVNLYMTARGVNYHLERSRSVLNARNTADLVRIAKESCIL